ncbi:MAG: RNA-binding S4 domain-containing protein [Christensenellales bacterium]|jgi:ribosomal 50S subunit-recycling heat shock protein
MRLDKFLKVSRVIKRRTVAAEAADAGRITLNGRPAKPSSRVKEGDVLEISSGNRVEKYEILLVTEIAGKAQAAEMVRVLR